jgi:hypothetical protein
VSVVGECVGVKHWWNDEGKTELLGENPVSVTLFPPKSHMDSTRIEPGPPLREADD